MGNTNDLWIFSRTFRIQKFIKPYAHLCKFKSIMRLNNTSKSPFWKIMCKVQHFMYLFLNFFISCDWLWLLQCYTYNDSQTILNQLKFFLSFMTIWAHFVYCDIFWPEGNLAVYLYHKVVLNWCIMQYDKSQPKWKV